jgi:HlyD family secretion protein
LSVEVAGRVVVIHHREGSKVSQGTPLLELDDVDARAALALSRRELESVEALFAEAKVRVDHAQRELARNLEVGPGILSDEVLDRTKFNAESAQAQLDAAGARVRQQRSGLERVEAQLAKHVLRAPFDGVIAERSVEVGEWALPGRSILRLIDLDRLYVRAELDEVDLARVQEGLPVRVTLDPYRDRKFQGGIVRVAPHVSDVEAQNRTVEIEVEFEDAKDLQGLKPGTSADVEVVLQKQANVLRIPAYALLEGSRVMLARNDRVEARGVVPGLKNWEFVEVREGLQEGFVVIVSLDREEVRPGARIRIAEWE